jgi:hypothetical protein
MGEGEGYDPEVRPNSLRAPFTELLYQMGHRAFGNASHFSEGNLTFP